MLENAVTKKRPAPDVDLDDSLEIESTQAWGTPSRKTKKPRFRSGGDNQSDYALSTAASIADTDINTVTVADTETPHTDATSTRSKTKPKSREKKYKCTFPECDKAFDRPVRLQSHINSHTGARPYICSEDGCDKSFVKPEHLNRHMKEKHSDQSFVCDYQCRKEDTGAIGPCGKVFESSNKLKRHRAMHEEKEDTTCSWEGCGKVFRKQETLQRHIKKDHLQEDSFMCSRESADGEACGQCFATVSQLKTHHAREHDAPKYICELYDFDSNIIGSLSLGETHQSDSVVSFPTYHELQRHLKAVHPPTCNQCGKVCRSQRDLTAHMEIEHAGQARPAAEKKFMCPYHGCSRSMPGNGFTKKGNMEVHIKSAHTKIKEFICGQFDMRGVKKVQGWNGYGCGQAIGTKQALIGHIRTQHMGLAAEVGKSTGLQDKDRKRKVNFRKQGGFEDKDSAMAMDTEDSPQASPPSKTLALLTGSGYEELRPYACILAAGPRGCQLRLTNEIELCTHMELTHGWTIEDINEAIQRGHTRPQEAGPDDTFGRRLETDLGAATRKPTSTDVMVDRMLNSTESMIDPRLNGGMMA
ncbi:hypothetical protein DOTSEDRAFT_163794 [Dothistroma septosporum NZE10]|uniref:C2H2-type domain-containing protein n=1 Tax=Dothistroma septosporum (strain NZE10 / CBS 128990) TaxID=675120 RepID=N1Q0Y3_DOTSN|nr:hypothetical protein DOTSEDRAFT_163794 [Dothistroma septosporum NZE10]